VALIDAIVGGQDRPARRPSSWPPRWTLQRKAQWRIDFIAAENSMGFHAPQEAARILGEAAWTTPARARSLLLRADDPLVPVLTAEGEAFVALDVNPSAENLARLIFEHLRGLGFPIVAVRFYETETSVALYARPLETARP
jgi:hypothetical protein